MKDMSQRNDQTSGELGWEKATAQAQARRQALESTNVIVEDGGYCPACAVERDSYHAIPGISLLDAEECGFVRIGPMSRKYFVSERTMFVFCQYCDWWGYPPEAEVIRNRNGRVELRRIAKLP